MREVVCDRCGKAIQDARLVKELVRNGRYGQTIYDLCEDCYREFRDVFLKHYAQKDEEWDG